MSTIQENEKWASLSRIMSAMTNDQETRIKAELKVDEICVEGLAKSVHMSETFTKLLSEIGFTKEERTKVRNCVTTGCPYNDNLYNMLNHFIGYHNIPIKNIANLLPVMKADTTVPDQSWKNKMQTNHMQAD